MPQGIRSTLERLMDLLDLPDADYWADVGSGDARALIDQSPTIVLSEVRRQWQSWPVMRQEHLAYILGESSLSIEKEILLEMVESGNSSVAMSAREALRSIPDSDA
jgi:hypothetical protein